MSYCRWSSDNFNCDLYCFEHCGGWWQTYVASSRQRVWFRMFHWITDKRIHSIRGKYAMRIPRFQTWHWPHWLTHKPIRHPLAGAAYEDPTEADMFERIWKLNQQGFKVPQHLLTEINEKPTNGVRDPTQEG
jgi:hypothetical protein